ncbi:MAG: helix-turn-helix domain-containing protein [Oscillospiraceae bacterium]|nr:helix-turn-helix domain-containing protein [Oscillospiraceae bacterium]
MKGQIRKSVAQQIVETVKDVSGHDVNFIDKNGVIFASTDPDRVGAFHEIGRQVVKTGQTIEVETDGSFFGTQKGVNIPFHYQGELIAVIGISGAPNEVRKFAYLAQRITLLILREQELNEQSSSENAQLNYIIRSLIMGEPVNYDYYMDFMRKLQLDTKASFRTIVVRVEGQCDPASRSLAESSVYQAFEQTGAKLYTFSYPNEYILLIEAERFQKWDHVFRHLSKSHQKTIKIGIGSSAPLTHQDRSYQAAQIALASLAAGQNLALFDQLNLEILLGTIPADAKRRFLEKTVLRLTERDQELLKTYFGCGMSLKAASDALFIHKNTLQYQLDRIWKESGYNPRSFQDAVILYLGLKLLP